MSNKPLNEYKYKGLKIVDRGNEKFASSMETMTANTDYQLKCSNPECLEPFKYLDIQHLTDTGEVKRLCEKCYQKKYEVKKCAAD